MRKRKKPSYIKSVLSSNSNASSKRVVGIGIAIIIVIVVFINIFTGKGPAEYIFNGLVDIEMIAFGAVAVENASSYFKNFRKQKYDSENIDIPDNTDTSDNTEIPKANL